MLPGNQETSRYVITPLFWLSLGLLAGILLGDELGGSSLAWLAGAFVACLAALTAAIYLRRRTVTSVTPAQVSFNRPVLHSIVLAPLMLAALCLGAARDRAVTQPLDPSYIGWYARQDLTAIVEGVLVGPSDERDRYANLLVQVEQVQAGEQSVPQPVSGLLLASVPPGDWQYGDRLRLEGEITLPGGESASYRQYLLRHGITATMPFPKAQLLEHGQGKPLLAVIYHLRERALHTVYRLFPDPEASLLMDATQLHHCMMG